MNKIGILGGTFNPIHNGHLMLARQAISEFGLDSVLVMPSGISYLKEGTGVLDSAIRREMTSLAIKYEDKLILDDREVYREGNSYTCDTISELVKEYTQNTQFYYIIGTDSLFNIHRWKDIGIIFDNCIILVAHRDNAPIEEMQKEVCRLESQYNASIKFMHNPNVEISSTNIRNMVRLGQSIEGYVPKAVLEYIEQNELYR